MTHHFRQILHTRIHQHDRYLHTSAFTPQYSRYMKDDALLREGTIHTFQLSLHTAYSPFNASFLFTVFAVYNASATSQYSRYMEDDALLREGNRPMAPRATLRGDPFQALLVFTTIIESLFHDLILVIL